VLQPRCGADMISNVLVCDCTPDGGSAALGNHSSRHHHLGAGILHLPCIDTASQALPALMTWICNMGIDPTHDSSAYGTVLRCAVASPWMVPYLWNVQLSTNLRALAAAYFVGVDGLVCHKASHLPWWVHQGLARWR
jgi:hypothetical protein